MLNNKTTIYWSYSGEYQIRTSEPVPMIKNYFKSKNAEHYDYIRCPSFQSMFGNTFGLKSIFNYSIKFTDNDVISDMHDQKFYEQFLFLRNLNSQLASFNMHYFFLSEDKDLEIEYLPSMMENNTFNNSAILVPGKLNIGKYVRYLDCAFHARKKTVEIKEDDIYAYVKFNTNKQIEFKRFYCTDEIDNLIIGQNITKYRAKTFKPLNWYYKKQQNIKLKERVIKLIKENLV